MNCKVSLLLHAVLCLPIACAVAVEPAAQTYPSRPIRLIVPQTPGGTADTVARMIAPGLSAVLGQQMVIDNRGGAGGIIGTELAAKAVPDGYTISLNSGGPMTILPHIQKQVPYDPIKDFVPVSLITISPFALVAHPSVPARTVKELITLAKAEPGKFNYASAGSASVIYLGMELFKSMAGISILHVPYKGSAQGLTDVLGGHVALMLFAVPPVLQHAKAERLRLLGITSAKRSPQLPDIPTISEAGMPGYEVTTWMGVFVPLKTPSQIVARLRDALAKAIRAPDTRPQFEAQGMDLVGSSPEEFASFIRMELAKNAKIIKASGGKTE
ncbi:MAG: tripartite tricarboxylate transporter substrate binding protein [Betaproteobacteria bacterium]|nr:tripartite tricarboxylate transporter substrate binding protein [Betaproteobacteria bacterium]